MARKIIILEKLNDSPDVNHYRYALWASVPVARQSFYADPNIVSAVIGANAPTNTEATALTNGSVVETVQDGSWPVATPIVQIQTDLTTAFNTYQALINATNPWVRYGTSFDGTTWTAKSTA
jgi:hypothetical protein